MLCQVARFYSYTVDYIRSLPVEDFKMLWQAMDRMIGIESLRAMYISDYANTTDENRKKMHRETLKTARPEYFIERAVTTEDLMEKYGR